MLVDRLCVWSMTISYSGSFLRILIRWKGSIWRSTWKVRHFSHYLHTWTLCLTLKSIFSWVEYIYENKKVSWVINIQPKIPGFKDNYPFIVSGVSRVLGTLLRDSCFLHLHNSTVRRSRTRRSLQVRNLLV